MKVTIPSAMNSHATAVTERGRELTRNLPELLLKVIAIIRRFENSCHPFDDFS
jgi:hypothetical protein